MRSGQPLPVLGRDLGGGAQAGLEVVAHQLAEQPLAAAAAIGPGGVEGGAAQLDGPVQRCPRLIIVAPGPLAHPPHAEPDFADLPVCPAGESVAHARTSASAGRSKSSALACGIPGAIFHTSPNLCPASL